MTRKLRVLEQQFAGREKEERRLQELQEQQDRLQYTYNHLQEQCDEYVSRLQTYDAEETQHHVHAIKSFLHHLQTIVHHIDQL